MSNGFSIRVKRDDITPYIRKTLKTLERPEPILRAMGTEIVSITKRAFTDTSLRQTLWPDRAGNISREGITKEGVTHFHQRNAATGRMEHNLLMRKGTLRSSIRITSVTARNVTVGSDRKYAAIQQFGGTITAKGKALVFVIGGKTIFAKSVTIPARPFFPFTSDGKLAAVAIDPIREVLTLASARALGIK